MKAKIKKQWIEALLSGEYEQGMGYLRDANNQFCCLGVLCDLAEKAGVTKAYKVENETYPFRSHFHYDKIEGQGVGVLPQTVIEWCNFDLDQNKLIDLNDGNASFSLIAEKIKNNTL